jgi:hypothetical protein
VRTLELAVLLAVAAPGVLGARQEPAAPPAADTVELEVRVGSAERGWALIDRGTADGLAPGDVVVFQPRGDAPFHGTVRQAEERAARVELADRDRVPAAGTRGKVTVPRSRVAGQPRTRVRPAPRRAEGAAPPPVFENQDDEWREGEPLLARVRPLRPAERATRAHGRSYAILDHTQASEDDRHDTFARVGGELVVENPFGAGGRLHADAEWNYRHVDVPDDDDEEDVELRVERLSYAWGGTRFDPTLTQVGRFLQSGMPELGILDGVEWVARRENGHRFGASIGYLPEPDEEFQTGSDFQLAGFYRWVADESERTAAALAYQKTFHNGAADRDLFVAQFQRLPRVGWTVFATAWLDVYTDGDDEKGTLLGLTQAYVTTGRRFDGGSTLDLVYSHLEFPEIDRDEFLPVADDQLADDHVERLAVRSGVQIAADVRMLTGVGAWVDEDDEGGDAEFGFALDDVLAAGGFVEVLGFASRGSFEKLLGVRTTFGRFDAGGRWAFDYWLEQHRFDGFDAENDDLPQHRLRFSRDHGWSKWHLSWRLEGLLYDDENALSVGLYLQRTHY